MRKRFDAIACDWSAWQYWSTPPAIRDVELPLELACTEDSENLGVPRRVVLSRCNERAADRAVRSHVLTDLKGVSLPVHAIIGDGYSGRKSLLVHPCRIRIDLRDDELVDLGNGLAVTSVESTLRHLVRFTDEAIVLEKMFEACGIYSVIAKTSRVSAAISLIEDLKTAAQTMRGINAYRDASGCEIFHVDKDGEPLGWKPAFDVRGNLTDLWKRPPLTTCDRLIASAEAAVIPRSRGTRRAVNLARCVIGGSGSPLETKAAIMLFAPRSEGGEGLRVPHLNRIIKFTQDAAILARQPYCIGDMVDTEGQFIIEVNGEAFHAGREEFRYSSRRRAALANMGYTVLDIDYEILSDLERFDAFLQTYARVAGVSPADVSTRFLARRKKLHEGLFSHEPGQSGR